MIHSSRIKIKRPSTYRMEYHYSMNPTWRKIIRGWPEKAKRDYIKGRCEVLSELLTADLEEMLK